MVEAQRSGFGEAVAPGGVPACPGSTTADLSGWRQALAGLDRDVSDGERVDQLRALEELKAAACAAQARVAVDLEASQRQAQASAGVPASRRGRGIGAQVALARRESPNRGGRLLGLAKALTSEMPHTFAALAAGVLSEWRATLLVRESACLSVADRGVFDARVAADPTALERLGDRALVARAKEIAYRLDGASVVRRMRRAESQRCVSVRPAPDTMTYVTGLLPVAQGVGVYAALTRVADTLAAQGDPRSRGQIMADTLVERVTGQDRATDVGVEVQVVMTERALLAGDDEPATIPGYGPVPAAWARHLIHHRLGTSGEPEHHDTGDDTRGEGGGGRKIDGDRGRGGGDGKTLVWLRRLFTHPGTGHLIAMDSRRRLAPKGLARFVDTRDQTCRTPWCDAPIRHRDHVTAHADGGPTTATNLQGTCEACNHNKQAPGWAARALSDADGDGHSDERAGPGQALGHVVETTTPTGHRYLSTAPPLPGTRPPIPARPGAPPGPQERDSTLENHLADIVWAA